MCDGFTLALDEFRTIRDSQHQAGFASKRMADWIRRDAVRAIEELVYRPDFRSAARWSVERLKAGAQGEERQLVEKVDAALVHHASALSALARHADVALKLANPIYPPANKLFSIVPIARMLGPLDFIVERPWRDLVSTGDFLGPNDRLNLKPEFSQELHPAEFVPMLNDALRQPGDHVAGMLLRRMQFWRVTLDAFHNHFRSVASGVAANEWSAANQAASHLRDSAKALEALLTVGPEARLREACVILTQAYADFSPAPDLSWAGAPVEPHQRGHFRLWLQNHDERAVALRIAAALGEAAVLYRRQLAADEVLAETSRRYSLVLAQGRGTRVVHWRGAKLEGPWENECVWKTLWELASGARSLQGIDHRNFGEHRDGGPRVNPHLLTVWINRLKNHLPPDFSKLIDGRTVPGTYKLKLTPKAIYLSEIFDDGVVEVRMSARSHDARALLAEAGLGPP